MAENSYFFTAVSGSPAYSATDMCTWLYNAMGRPDGVLRGEDNGLAVTSDGAGNAVVATGCAVKSGHGYQNTANLSKALTLPASGYKQYTTLVVRVDSSVSPNTMRVVTIAGTAVLIANTATPPSIVSGTDVYLADVLVANTAGTYSYTVADQRVYANIAAPNGVNWYNALTTALGSNWATALSANAQSGSVNGIDAKTLLTYSPGNSSGNVPLNNGNLNTSLNSDLWDYYHRPTNFALTGSMALETSLDASTCVSAGEVHYCSSTCSNIPIAAYGTLVSLGQNTTGLNQLYIVNDGLTVYLKTFNTWIKLVTSSGSGLLPFQQSSDSSQAGYFLMANNSLTLPIGGTWGVASILYSAVANSISFGSITTAAGGQVFSSISGYSQVFLYWRISV